jgi:lipopolysaccharide assembly outer membrane protein LptD (OstA)
MLTPTFPQAATALKSKGWGVEAVSITADYLGEKNLSGRLRYLVTTGHTQFESFGVGTAAEQEATWTAIGQDPEHAYMDAGRAFTQRRDLPRDDVYTKVLERWRNEDYLGLVFSLCVTSTTANASAGKFVTITASFHCSGPPASF